MIKPLTNLFMVVIWGLTVFGYAQQATAQKRKTTSTFTGEWTWSYYLKDKDLRDPEIVGIYKHLAGGMNIRKAPFMSLDLDLNQKENILTGGCSSIMRFGNRMDDSGFSTIIKNGVARIELESSLGGRLTVQLTRRRDRLYWEIIKADNSEGEYWYPERAVLRKVRRVGRVK